MTTAGSFNKYNYFRSCARALRKPTFEALTNVFAPGQGYAEAAQVLAGLCKTDAKSMEAIRSGYSHRDRGTTEGDAFFAPLDVAIAERWNEVGDDAILSAMLEAINLDTLATPSDAVKEQWLAAAQGQSDGATEATGEDGAAGAAELLPTAVARSTTTRRPAPARVGISVVHVVAIVRGRCVLQPALSGTSGELAFSRGAVEQCSWSPRKAQ